MSKRTERMCRSIWRMNLHQLFVAIL